MQRTKPPFRADHVGSLLRSSVLKDARAQKERGEITPDQLKAIEDREIEILIKKQEATGLKSITDGENRRKSWQTDFIAALPGIETYQGKRKVAFQGGVQPPQVLVRVARKRGACASNQVVAPLRAPQGPTRQTPETTVRRPRGVRAGAVGATSGCGGVGPWTLLKIVDATVGVRVTREEEREGLDIVLHGEQVF